MLGPPEDISTEKGASLPAGGPNGRSALLPRGPLEPGSIGRVQPAPIGFDSHGTLSEHHRQEYARGEVGPGRRRVTAVPVVQDRLVVSLDVGLPDPADGYDR